MRFEKPARFIAERAGATSGIRGCRDFFRWRLV